MNGTSRSVAGMPPTWSRPPKSVAAYEPLPHTGAEDARRGLRTSVQELDLLVKTRGETPTPADLEDYLRPRGGNEDQ